MGRAGLQLTGDVGGIWGRRKVDENHRTQHRGEQGRGVGKGHDALGKDLRRRMAAVEGEVASLRRDGTQGTGAGHAGAGPSQAEAGASDAGRKPPSRPTARREYPDLVTLEPAEDDEAVFGDAWPLIVEWRGLKNARPNEGHSLAWLAAEEERLRVVELALLEDHGMTLPPEKRPLREFDRDGQINWRRIALFDTRRARRKRELLNRLSLGLWWR